MHGLGLMCSLVILQVADAEEMRQALLEVQNVLSQVEPRAEPLIAKSSAQVRASDAVGSSAAPTFYTVVFSGR